MKNTDLLIYRIATGLLTLIMMFSATMYFTQYEMVSQKFSAAGFATYIIYPMAIAKILGLVAIWTDKSTMLREWAYAGFVFNLLLAIGAHLDVQDGEYVAPIVGLVAVGVSYFYKHKLLKAPASNE
ncbi:DoxX family protein [uncultured Microscilla sp.]|uniref:DoxX family protein n=1 Tax=uncultured Microscilla sp. TaxID=432653 RepID=UPI0026128751|nr:DoxX family protein [uncultured Microscilla sp.]